MEKLIKNATVIYAFLIFLGFSYLHIYYQNFDLDIFPYLEIGELLLSFLKIVNTTLIALLLIIIMSSGNILLSYFGSVTSVTNSIKYFKKEENIKKKKIVEFLMLIAWCLFLLYSTYINILPIIRKMEHLQTRISLGYFILTGIFIGVYFLLFYLYKVVRKVAMSESTKKNYQLIMIILYCFCFNAYNARAFALLTKYKVIETAVSFNYEDKNYNTCDTLYYIGATHNYIYLWSTKGYNYIFDKGRITNLKLKEIQQEK